jgi:hypothetical protein
MFRWARRFGQPSPSDLRPLIEDADSLCDPRYDTSMDEKLRRRCFAFRLRTLFVAVAVLSIPMSWVAYQMKWIRERHAFLASDDVDEYSTFHFHAGERQSPDGLWILGEPGVHWIFLNEGHALTASQIMRLFPESEIADPDAQFPGRYGPLYNEKYLRVLPQIGGPGFGSQPKSTTTRP